MGNLVFINIESFLHDNIVYEWDARLHRFISHDFWNKYTEECYHYEFKNVPKEAHILRYHIVKGGYKL